MSISDFPATMPDNWPQVMRNRADACYVGDSEGTRNLLYVTADYLDAAKALVSPAVAEPVARGRHLWAMEEIAATLLTGDRAAATKLREAIDFFTHPSPAVIAEVTDAWPEGPFDFGDHVEKTKGSSWHGRVCGWYSTSLTPLGYNVESEREPGSVQLYPAAALSSVHGGGE